MLIAVKAGAPPMLAETVRTEIRGRRLLQVLEGYQQIAGGRFERVRVVVCEQPCNDRRLWN